MMSTLDLILQSLFLIFLIILSAFFSGSEVALVSIDKITLKKLSKQRTKGVGVLKKLKKRPRRMLTTILIGNNVVNVLVSSIATVVSVDIFGSLGVGIAVGIITFFILIFGEIFPKTYCSVNNVKTALIAAPIIYGLSRVFSPIIVLFEVIPQLLFKYFFKIKPKNSQITEEDILSLTEIGFEEKAIQKREKETIERILRFNDVRVKDVMVPKKDVIFMNADITAKKSLSVIDEHGHSRYPVFESRRTNVVGIVHIKEILRAIEDEQGMTKIRYLTINTEKVDEEETIDKIFKKFQKSRVHMGLVFDKKGNMKGVITFEDILEEIFGEIEDEEDVVRAFESAKL